MKPSLNVKKLTSISILLALGVVFHFIVPPLFMGVKPDFLLVTMFLSIMLTDTYKEALSVFIVSGILSALTTGFPGGQLPNVIDKLITGNIIFLIHKNLHGDNIFKNILMFFLGTIISGATFLGSASILVGLPTSYTALLLTVVLPTSLINTFLGVFLYKIILTKTPVFKEIKSKNTELQNI